VLKLRAATYWITYIQPTKPAHFCVIACCGLWIHGHQPFFNANARLPQSEPAADRTRTCAADQARGIVAPPQSPTALPAPQGAKQKKWALRGKMGVQRRTARAREK
jgi:hypothetical protein